MQVKPLNERVITTRTTSDQVPIFYDRRLRDGKTSVFALLEQTDDIKLACANRRRLRLYGGGGWSLFWSLCCIYLFWADTSSFGPPLRRSNENRPYVVAAT